MKQIGIIGGVSWQSTQLYYQTIQNAASNLNIPLCSVPTIINSLDFNPIAESIKQQDWQAIIAQLRNAADQLSRAGVDVILLANNTLHTVYDDLSKGCSIPWICVSEPILSELKQLDVRNVCVLGTSALLKGGFYQQRLNTNSHYELTMISSRAQASIDQIIFNELCKGDIRSESKDFLQDLINQLKDKGVEAIILACTELPLLANELDLPIPALDSSQLHAMAAFNFATQGKVQ